MPNWSNCGVTIQTTDIESLEKLDALINKLKQKEEETMQGQGVEGMEDYMHNIQLHQAEATTDKREHEGQVYYDYSFGFEGKWRFHMQELVKLINSTGIEEWDAWQSVDGTEEEWKYENGKLYFRSISEDEIDGLDIENETFNGEKYASLQEVMEQELSKIDFQKFKEEE